ncbi:hypothetical protein [Methanosphaera sp.]
MAENKKINLKQEYDSILVNLDFINQYIDYYLSYCKEYKIEYDEEIYYVILNLQKQINYLLINYETLNKHEFKTMTLLISRLYTEIWGFNIVREYNEQHLALDNAIDTLILNMRNIFINDELFKDLF